MRVARYPRRLKPPLRDHDLNAQRNLPPAGRLRHGAFGLREEWLGGVALVVALNHAQVVAGQKMDDAKPQKND